MKPILRQMRRCVGIVAMSLLVSAAAHAEPTASDKAAAEALFDEGRALVAAGELKKACARLEASQKLDPGTGTLLYLADAYAKNGRTASAWATFREAAATVRAGRQPDRESIARARRGAGVEARVSPAHARRGRGRAGAPGEARRGRDQE